MAPGRRGAGEAGTFFGYRTRVTLLTDTKADRPGGGSDGAAAGAGAGGAATKVECPMCREKADPFIADRPVCEKCCGKTPAAASGEQDKDADEFAFRESRAADPVKGRRTRQYTMAWGGGKGAGAGAAANPAVELNHGGGAIGARYILTRVTVKAIAASHGFPVPDDC